ncbi:hypothetical protein, partial [Yersinia kristensenii]
MNSKEKLLDSLLKQYPDAMNIIEKVSFEKFDELSSNFKINYNDESIIKFISSSINNYPINYN